MNTLPSKVKTVSRTSKVTFYQKPNMKAFLLLPLAMALPAFAGTSEKQVVAPAPDPCVTTWFAGASVGYLVEMDAPMYNAHVGVTNSCWKIAGWDTAFYLEVGYAQKSWTDSYYSDGVPFHDNYKVEVLPITLNVKFERNLTGNLNGYFGGGLGMAWMNADASGTSDSDWVFTAQVFAGLSYNVSPSCEIYGGARWIYYSDPTWFGSKQDLGNLPGFSGNIGSDWLFELGARFKF